MNYDNIGLSKQTASFVEALSLVMDAEDRLYKGYSEIYGGGLGEGEGADQYGKSELSRQIDRVKTAIKLQIGISIENNIEERNEQI